MAAEPMNINWLRGAVISTVVAAAAYLATVLWVGRVEVSAALSLTEPDKLLALLALSAANYLLRFLRWHWFLRKLGGVVPFFHDLRIYIGAFALTATPAKAGEMVRSLWLRPFGVPATFSLAAFLAERLLDFLALLLIAVIGASLYQGVRWLLLFSAGLILIALTVLYVPSVVRSLQRLGGGGQGRMARLLRRMTEILELTRGCLNPARFSAGLLIGLFAWGAEALGFFLLMQMMAHPLPLSAAFSIYSLSMLAGALSFMPGGLGGSEASMILLLRFSQVPMAIAVSATLLIRLATLWFAVLLGMLALLIPIRTPGPNAGLAARSTPADSV